MQIELFYIVLKFLRSVPHEQPDKITINYALPIPYPSCSFQSRHVTFSIKVTSLRRRWRE